MTKNTQAAYNAAQQAIDTHGSKLSKSDYADYIGELAAFLEGVQDCLREEQQSEEGS